jgi:hypothetical protein
MVYKTNLEEPKMERDEELELHARNLKVRQLTRGCRAH